MHSLLMRALILATAMLITAVSLVGQDPAVSSAPVIAVRISLQKEKIPLGQSPWVDLRVENLTDREITIDPFDPHIHVEGEKGELPLKPNAQVITDGRRARVPRLRTVVYVAWTIPAKESSIRSCQLAHFFDLSNPGEYTVYMEVADPFSHRFLRTNRAKFEMQSASH